MIYTGCVKKETELFQQRSNQHRVRAAATEGTERQVFTTNCHSSRFAMSISRRDTFVELEPSDNERA
jgi:hypothetical protein